MTTKFVVFTLAAVLIATGAIFSDEAQVKKEADPFDLSAIQKRIDEAGIPTPQIVQQFENNAVNLMKQEKWQEAADAYASLARSANWLANIINVGLQPFYGASYDERKAYSIKPGDIRLEGLSNGYKQKRDQATVYEAECFIHAGDNRKALPLLVRSLELINVKDEALWLRARKDLYSLVQVQEQ